MPNVPHLTPELLREHGASLRSLARQLLADEAAAEDVVQETWIAYLDRPPRDGSEGAVAAWLRKVVRRLALNRLRSEGRRTEREARRAASLTSSPERPQSAEERARILRAVTDAVLELDEPYRSSVLLRYFENLPPREIAVREGVSVATVKSRLQRALPRLRASLGHSFPDEASWQRSLALLVGLPLPPVALPPVPAPAEPPPGVEAGALGAKGVGTLLGWTALNVKLVSVGAALVAAAGLYVGMSREPAASEPAGLAQVEEAQDEGAAVAGELGDASRSLERREALDPAVVVSEGEPGGEEANTPVAAAVYRLRGSVLDKDDRPAAFTRVYLAPWGTRLNHVGTTDVNGRFDVSWRARSSRLEVGLAVAGVRGRASVVRRIEMVAAQPLAVRVTRPRNAFFAGRVQLVDGSGGGMQEVPIVSSVISVSAGASIAGTAPFSNRAPRALVDAEGDLWFRELDSGLFIPGDPLEVDPTKLVDGECPATDGVFDSFESSEGEPTMWGAELEPGDGPPPATVVVTLRDPYGRPTPEARIDLVLEDGHTESSADFHAASGDELLRSLAPPLRAGFTEQNGSYRFDRIDHGRVRLVAGGGAYGVARLEVDLSPGEVYRWDPVLDRGHELRARLIDGDGKPLAGWAIEAVRDEDGFWCDRTKTDEDGRFAIPNCPEGEFTLVGAPGDPVEFLPRLRLEGLWSRPYAEQDDYPERIVEPLATGSLELRLANSRQEYPAGAEVVLQQVDSGRWVLFSMPNTEGALVAEELPVGAYRLLVITATLGPQEHGEVWITAGQRTDHGSVAVDDPGLLVLARSAALAKRPAAPSLRLWRKGKHVDTLTRDTHLFRDGWMQLGAGGFELTADVGGRVARSSFQLETQMPRSMELDVDQAGARWNALPQTDPARMLVNARALGPSCIDCHSY